MTLIRVTLPHLCAGVLAEDGVIRQAAPILAWSVGREVADLARWVLKRGGRVEVLGGCGDVRAALRRDDVGWQR